MPRSTSLVKKNFPSAGTIMICSLSDRRSATILLISKGFCFRIVLSLFMRSASAAAVSFSLRQELAALHLGLAVDQLGLAGSLRVLDRRLFTRFGFQLRLLNLLFLQRQQVLHRICF